MGTPPPTEMSAGPRRRGPYAKSAERRQAILDAAVRVFAARGFRATSLREVALAAGIGVSTLVHHFATKEDLLLATLHRRDEMGQPGSTRADGEQFLAFVLHRARSNVELRGLIELYTVVCAEATTADHPGTSYFTERFRLLREEYAGHFAELGSHGRLRPGVDPERAATSLVALWDGLQLQWLMEPERVDVARHLQDFLELVTVPAGEAAP